MGMVGGSARAAVIGTVHRDAQKSTLVDEFPNPLEVVAGPLGAQANRLPEGAPGSAGGRVNAVLHGAPPARGHHQLVAAYDNAPGSGVVGNSLPLGHIRWL